VLELIPLRHGLKDQGPSVVELLLRIVTPLPEDMPERPQLNLALVLDRSGSMSGQKLHNTILASQQLLRALQGSDRISVVLFDDKVNTLVPSTLISQNRALDRTVGTIQAGGSTDLHSGWLEGATQVAQHLDPECLNRVLLLTDGQANVGETNVDTIATHVNGLAQRGVSTSTLGFGTDYNENLLRSMAASGDGNHYFVEAPSALAEIFELELGGLMSTVGQKVRLTLEAPGRVEVLTNLERDDAALRLNDLVLGNPLHVLLRIHVDDPSRQPLVCARLDYYDLVRKQMVSHSEQLSLPVVPEREWSRLRQHPQVLQELALREAARARKEVTVHLVAGDHEGATRILTVTMDSLSELPQTPLLEQHQAELRQLLDDVQQRNVSGAQKRAVQQEYSYYRGSVTLSGLPEVKKAIEAAKRLAAEKNGQNPT
jgi:Ca-activated chloride channel homolog